MNIYSSLTNKTGLLTMLPTYSYHPLQSFFSPSIINDLVTELRTEIAAHNLSPFQATQANLQIDLLRNRGIGQIEIAPYEGQDTLYNLYIALKSLHLTHRRYPWPPNPAYPRKKLSVHRCVCAAPL